MEEYMHVCTACNTYYSPNVATMVKNGKCKCGAPLVVSNITVDQYAKRSAAQSASSVSVPPAPVQVQYRKKPVPDEYNLRDQSASAGCLLGIAGVSLFVYAISQFFEGNFGSAIIAICSFFVIYLFVRIAEDLSAAVLHLGAIRWLLAHGDELEPVPDPAERSSALNKQKGPQISNKAFAVICIVLIALIVGGLVISNYVH